MPGEHAAGDAGLSVRRDAHSWTLALDRPRKANALSAPLVEALIDAVAQAEAARVPVLAFEGRGGNLSAGFDFGDYESQSEGELLLRFVRIETLLQAIARSTCLTIGFAHGRNFGAGVDLFGACRSRIAAPETTFRMPGLAFGLVLGTRRFARLVGSEAAREILEGLATFDAERARRMGFVRRIAPPAEWPAVLAEAVATAGSLAYESRVALYRTLDEETHDADLADLARSASRPGLRERIASYLATQRAARA
ncbi:MAG TPA: enoyl-CoA hydratase/isomerase family protein [Usitatibacter sp.]|nr:enoyl-CoA hydratase/isomerase family protein [Usitatibacter sp.]